MFTVILTGALVRYVDSKVDSEIIYPYIVLTATGLFRGLFNVDSREHLPTAMNTPKRETYPCK